MLARREAASIAAAAMEQKIPGALPARRKVFVDRLARLFSDLESDRKTGLALPNGRTVDGIAMRGDVLDPEPHHVAATQLTVDRD